MNVIIVVFKSELSDNHSIIPELEKRSKEFTQVTSARIYSPYSGKLFECLSLLKEHKIPYGTHFDTRAEIP
jgi:hypothetical protein